MKRNDFKNRLLESLSKKRLITEKEGDTYDYACVMLKLELPKEWWNNIQDSIPDEDVYTEKGDRTFGREDEPHVTILYGIHADVSDEDVEEKIKELLPIEITLKKISTFENEKFDVLKFDVESEDLHKANKMFAKLPHTTDYPDYHPHTTIAYVKKGEAGKYKRTLSDDDAITLKGDTIIFSKADGTKKEYKLTSND